VVGSSAHTAEDLAANPWDRCDSLKALADADLRGKGRRREFERGETTLAAYRKVIRPAVLATLLNRMG